MTTTKELVEDWIQIRATLQQQLKMLESSEKQGGTQKLDVTGATAIRLKNLVGELNALLKEHARADRT